MPTTLDPAFRDEAPIPSGPPDEVRADDPRGQWPPMLTLDRDTEDRLTRWLAEEIRRAKAEKEDIIEDWKNWQADYFATPASETKDFPFRKAANIVVPLTATAVEAVVARLMNTIFAVEPFWSIRPQNEEWIEAAKPFEQFLQSEVKNPSALDVFEFAQNSITELVKLGTAVGKTGYERDIRKSRTINPGGGSESRWHERHNGATLDYVPVSNFLIRMGEMDPQEAPWVGEEHDFTWSQMKRMAGSGRMDEEALDDIKQWWQGRMEDEYQEEVDEKLNTEPIWNQKFDVKEIWASFDVDNDGWDEEIVVDFHWPSGTILSARYNWYDDMRRPYRVAQYFKVEGRIWGIGVGKQNEQFQDEVTAVHRQRLDNATLANMRMIALKKNSGYGPGEPVFPGKIWFLDDPQEDIQPLQMSEVYRSSIINEETLIRHSERRTGINDVLLGQPQEGTPGTATGTLQRIAEGNKRFDLVLKNVRRWFGNIGRDVVANYQQFGAQRRHFTVLGQEGEWVERILNMPQTLVADGAVVDLTATDSTTNREVQQRQWMELFQTITQYYDRVIQLGQFLAQTTGDVEMIIDPSRRAIAATNEAMKRLLETFDIADSDRLLLLPEDRTPQSGPTANGGQPGASEQGARAQPGQVSGRAAEGRGPTIPGADSALRVGDVATLVESITQVNEQSPSLSELASRGG